MKSFLTIVLACLLASASAKHWGVLIAGSNHYYNYRHQADVLHAYQLMITKGVSAENIITFAYDDIASSSQNPFPGKVFNKPTNSEAGVDVYAGVKIDYSGKDVTPQIFLDVLEGKKDKVSGKGTGRVLESTADDNVFMFFSDHGAPGLIGFPSSYLYANQLIQSFANMRGRYNKIVFYLESCQSGSMFDHLPTDTKIYALSAANPKESSYGTYCPSDDVIQGRHIRSCLGDLFSVKFLEDSDAADLTKVTLQEQFEEIRSETKLSHVMQWGDVSFVNDTMSEFLGASRSHIRKDTVSFWEKLMGKKEKTESSSIDSRMMKASLLSRQFADKATQETEKELREELKDIQRYDSTFSKFSEKFGLTGDYESRNLHFDCLRAMMEGYEAKCGRFSDYGLTYVKYFAQGCEKLDAAEMLQIIQC